MEVKIEVDQDLLMDLGDLGNPEKLARLIVQRRPQDCGPPICLEAIAQALGIAEVRRVDTDAYEGALVTDPEKGAGVILVRGRSRLERQRFTIAHEIGHFLIPTHGRDAQCGLVDLRSPERSKRKETEANLFAANLLMPARMLIEDMRRWREPELDKIVALASRYEVSKEAMARRVMELTDASCAIVFCRDSLVHSWAKSRTFPFLDLRVNGPVPPGSPLAKQPHQAGEKHDWRPVHTLDWLAGDFSGTGELFEQALDLTDGHRMVLLSYEDRDDED